MLRELGYAKGHKLEDFTKQELIKYLRSLRRVWNTEEAMVLQLNLLREMAFNDKEIKRLEEETKLWARLAEVQKTAASIEDPKERMDYRVQYELPILNIVCKKG